MLIKKIWKCQVIYQEHCFVMTLLGCVCVAPSGDNILRGDTFQVAQNDRPINDVAV